MRISESRRSRSRNAPGLGPDVGNRKARRALTASQQRRLLLTSRKLLQRKAYDIESDLRGQLRNFGLKVGVVGAAGFEQRVRDLVLDLPFVAAVVLPLLEARSALRTQLTKLHKMLLDQVRAAPVCRRLMTAPGVGPVVAPTYRTCFDNPARFYDRNASGRITV